ncbi:MULTISPECIES: hypothetical protein [Bradyrhizobium]|uniref:hypothetical protein n=1 Tax=Bradyrhizobium TaxID=374 RepID=UPI001EDBFC49|nr:hypothetical protein [Bradyrhizobium zhengyangense]MCG2639663.1 hypothetical protein [Bradyrhizobium zhengyangense]
MWPELELFLKEYRTGLELHAEHLVDVMRDEIQGIYETIESPAALEKWDEFRTLVRSPVPFRIKYERSRLLLAEACGKPNNEDEIQ